MDSTEFRKRGKEAIDYIADYLDSIEKRKVLPEVQPGYMKELLPHEAPEEPEKWEEVMADLERVIMPGITHWQHPKFHAYFPAGNSFPSIIGNMIADAFGCVGFSWAASPAFTELEVVVLDWIAKMIGLPRDFLHESGKGGGVIQGSASECILVSMLVARHSTLKDLKSKFPFVEEGVLLSRMVAYCSKLAHSCVEKAGMLSLVKMREVDIDDHFSLRGATFQKTVEDDIKQGLIPFYLCATLGSTAVCSFDNLEELGKVCAKEKVWMHVDGAYGGNAFICPEFRDRLKGIELASSFNMNPNKWFLTNFDCSTMWVKDRKLWTSALTVDPLYLQHAQSGKAIDFRHWGIPLSRRFRSLKLWFVIRLYGVSGLQKYIREHCRLAKKFESLILGDHRFQILGNVTLGLVCFRLKGHNYYTQMLLRAINMSGEIHMVPALIRDDYVIRFAVCAERASEGDICYAWEVVKKMATVVLQTCDVERDTTVRELERIASLELNEEDFPSSAENKSDGNLTGDDQIADASVGSDDEMFPYDINIPSIPSIKSLPEPSASNQGGPMPAYKRRNLLLRMISDPKLYNPDVLRSLSVERKRKNMLTDSSSDLEASIREATKDKTKNP